VIRLLPTSLLRIKIELSPTEIEPNVLIFWREKWLLNFFKIWKPQEIVLLLRGKKLLIEELTT
jgi:hypothetical protein